MNGAVPPLPVRLHVVLPNVVYRKLYLTYISRCGPGRSV